MKRRLISLFVFLTLALPFISAIDISMPTNVPQGQTVIASVQGNFLDAISKSNIHFYRNYVETSFDYDVARIGDTYYIYFQTLNKPQNNYSINISGVRYYVGSQISSETISKSQYSMFQTKKEGLEFIAFARLPHAGILDLFGIWCLGQG